MNYNSLTELNPAFWHGEAQKSLFVDNKALAIANTRLESILAGAGSSAHRTIVSYPASQTYTPGTDISSVPVTGSKETLSVDTFISSLVTIDDTEKKQSIIDTGALVAQRMMHDHNNNIEQRVLAEVTSSRFTLDDGSVGGTAGNNMVVNTNTIPQIFIAADTKLDAVDAPKAGRTAVVGGHFMGQLKLQQAGRPTVFGDGVNTRGVVTNLFAWDILYSNNLPYSAILTIATQPTDGDTVTIASVTFTFKTVLGATAGNVLIGANAAAARANLAALINTPHTTTAQGVALGAEDTFLLRDKRRVTAVDDAATKITISGYGDIVVSETLTAPADIWSAQRQDSLFLVAGSIDLVVQIPPQVEVARAPKQFADHVKSLVGMGKKTYADGARQMVRVKIDASTSDWV
ncbi:hypothetical protein [Bradyrhizobium elkanii]|uniref:hypothetical protein n=1 Tax=Bradyrhizobium elkanii TaxID=29448 RepID=UPI003D1D7340